MNDHFLILDIFFVPAPIPVCMARFMGILAIALILLFCCSLIVSANVKALKVFCFLPWVAGSKLIISLKLSSEVTLETIYSGQEVLFATTRSTTDSWLLGSCAICTLLWSYWSRDPACRLALYLLDVVIKFLAAKYCLSSSCSCVQLTVLQADCEFWVWMPSGVGERLNLSESSQLLGVCNELVNVLMLRYSMLYSVYGSRFLFELVKAQLARSFCIKRTQFCKSAKSYYVCF